MSLASETLNNPAIDNLVQSSYANYVQSSYANYVQSRYANYVQSNYVSDECRLVLGWIPYEGIINVKPTQTDNVYCAIRKHEYYDETIMMALLGNNEECTPTLVSEFARIYSLPTHKYNNNDNNFRRYSVWLKRRNKRIIGFTKSNDDNYYMVADECFYRCYSRYGFCSTCGILRCSPVWCICGYKQLSDGWTSNNHQLDDFIKKSQLQTNSPNDAYLEWMPFDCVDVWKHRVDSYGLPIHDKEIKLIPLEITDETHDLYYAGLCDTHPDILNTDVWVTIGFTYDTEKQKYCLINSRAEIGLCLACTERLEPKINAFCYWCKAPTPPDWTTGNKSLDSFIVESWSNTKSRYDAYIQWIEYSLLTNIQEMTPLRHGCTHIAEWNELTRVTLKKIVDEQNNQSLDFHQLTKEYPTILTPDNIWIIGITPEPSTRDFYLVFYYEIHTILDMFIRNNEYVKYMQYSDFYYIKQIGAGGYGTVYTAKYKKYSEVKDMQQTVVLKRFKNFDEMPELFISEFRNHAKCVSDSYSFLQIYGVTQDPETKEYMIVMQYANNGSLLSYLVRNINKLTWRDKLEHLEHIAGYLYTIHKAGLVHCDIHSGNIVMHDDNTYYDEIKSMICDLGLSQAATSRESNSTIRGVLPFIAPEVFHTSKFTQKSDVYSFGIIMYLIATGEPPFRDRQFDRDLVCDIMGGLRPSMPDSAPEEYKKLAERCCDADPDKRPDAFTISDDISYIIDFEQRDKSGDNVWNTVYHTDVKPLSCLEKESKYSSKLLPTGVLPKPRNSYELDSAAATQTFE